MENNLTFSNVYKSITSLKEISLPKLVILTGRNGSGKTHFLEAISAGHIRSTLAPNFKQDVQLFDWNSIIPKDTGIFHPAQHQTQRSNWFQQIKIHQESQFKTLQQNAINWGVPHENCKNLKQIQGLSEEKLKEIIPNQQQATQVYTNLNNQIKQLAQNIYSQSSRNIGDEQWKKAAPKILQEAPEMFFETSESKFFSNNKLLWGEVNAFQQEFGRLFSTYRDLIHQNDRLEN
ncbi:hypothetical protein B0W48_16780 [Pseudoalteromonas aliena]|uniref:Uncharacterized protein n=1 Tax=Pseudoalteromonas aliena TaxID=247523 RepID=A0A1Q2H1M1_9GAMM|nr:AAA family ATPase [Pseudoalteromonas aliena]AQQ01278.1 hypothetical protein B0W48_16780 [Pseudoalteromonas aliena]